MDLLWEEFAIPVVHGGKSAQADVEVGLILVAHVSQRNLNIIIFSCALVG